MKLVTENYVFALASFIECGSFFFDNICRLDMHALGKAVDTFVTIFFAYYITFWRNLE